MRDISYSFYEGYVESTRKAWWIKLILNYQLEEVSWAAYFVLPFGRDKRCDRRKRELILYEEY